MRNYSYDGLRGNIDHLYYALKAKEMTISKAKDLGKPIQEEDPKKKKEIDLMGALIYQNFVDARKDFNFGEIQKTRYLDMLRNIKKLFDSDVLVDIPSLNIKEIVDEMRLYALV